MMQDMGVELKKHNVAAISLWPGPVKTEVIEKFQEETVDAERVCFTSLVVLVYP